MLKQHLCDTRIAQSRQLNQCYSQHASLVGATGTQAASGMNNGRQSRHAKAPRPLATGRSFATCRQLSAYPH
jgi:hypothetical protein